MPNLAGKVCLVTGASRGIGRGIAIQLITYGATCYITGRNISTLELVGKEAKSRASTGKCIPVQCDHSNDEEIENLFKQISTEQNGRLDLLVNNAYSAVNYIVNEADKYFWDQPNNSWDIVNNVGLRNHYICSVYASRLMVPRRQGLIVNVSSGGGKTYMFMPQYGIGKAGKDRMAKDCAIELEKYNVTFVSLWPGPVKTELIQEQLDAQSTSGSKKEQLVALFSKGESVEFAGKCVAYLLVDENIIKRTGSILLTSDIAEEFGFNDVDGVLPLSSRSLRFIFKFTPLKVISEWIPSWIKFPKSIYMMMLSTNTSKTSQKEPSKYE